MSNKKLGQDIFAGSLDKKIKTVDIGEEFIRRTYMIRKKYIEMIDRESFWDRNEKQEVLDNALKEYFKDKNIKPIPSKVRENK